MDGAITSNKPTESAVDPLSPGIHLWTARLFYDPLRSPPAQLYCKAWPTVSNQIWRTERAKVKINFKNILLKKKKLKKIYKKNI